MKVLDLIEIAKVLEQGLIKRSTCSMNDKF